MDIRGNLKLIGGGYIGNMRPENLAADPVSPGVGQIWFNTTDGVLRHYDGTSIQTFAIGGSLSDYVKKDGSVAMTGELLLSGDASNVLGAVPKQQLDAGLATKQDTVTGAASTITGTDLTVNRALLSDASGKVAVSSVTSTELGYLSGVTSAVQTQLDGKQADLGYTPVNKAGDSLNGNLAMQSNLITGLGAPVNPTDAARKIDIENALSGLDFQADVLNIQVDNTLDPGATPTSGDRYLITDSANLHANFGTITGVGDDDIVQYDGSAFVVAYDVSVAGSGALVWDRTSLTWQRYDGTSWTAFGGLGDLNAGVGLAKSGNTISVNLGAGIAQLPTDEVGLDIKTDGGLALVDPTSGLASTATDAVLSLLLDGSTLSKSNSGVKIAANGVTETEINTSAVGNGLQGAGGTAISVKADTGISVSASGVAFDTTFGDGRYLTLTGGTLTGSLILAGDASAALEAVTKQQLDSSVSTINTSITNLTNRLVAGHFVYDGTGSSQTSHTVTHNMNNKYVQVSVVDSSDNVIIPDTISYTDANSLTVTLGSAAGIRVIVTGVKN